MVEDGLVAGDSSLVAAAEDVVVVVCELLAADGADYMVRARLGLFELQLMLLVGQKLLGLFLKVFVVFGV